MILLETGLGNIRHHCTITGVKGPKRAVKEKKPHGREVMTGTCHALIKERLMSHIKSQTPVVARHSLPLHAVKIATHSECRPENKRN